MSEGCRNCYAERVAGTRLSGPGRPYDGLAVMTAAGPRWTGEVRLIEDKLDQPLRWKRPRRIFVNSMSDLFHEKLTDEQIDRIVAVMAQAKWHTFQVLTKRPERMAEYLKRGPVWQRGTVNEWPFWPLPNVWWGTSAEDQKTLNDRAQHLLACRPNAAVLWLSLEPLLGPAILGNWARLPVPVKNGVAFMKYLDWVVVGGESGPDARPMHQDWARKLRDECAVAGVPFHFKQWGEWTPLPWTNDTGKAVVMFEVDPNTQTIRIGTKAAGRLLDGKLHDDMPAMPAER